MTLSKITIITLIIGAGLLGSYWIIQDAKQTAGETAGFSFEQKINLENAPLKAIKESIQEIQKIIKNENLNSLSLNNQLPENSNNLTEIVAKAVVSGILEKNKGELTMTEQGEPKLLMPNKEALLQELTNQLANLDAGLLNLNQPINRADLKISQDNSLEAQNKYIEGIRIITQVRFGNFPKQNISDILEKTINTGDTTQVKKLSKLYRSVIGDYLALEVPLRWLNFHKKVLTHFQNAEVIYSTLANFQNDPLKSLLAIEAWYKLPQSAQKIQEVFKAKSLKIGYN